MKLSIGKKYVVATKTTCVMTVHTRNRKDLNLLHRLEKLAGVTITFLFLLITVNAQSDQIKASLSRSVQTRTTDTVNGEYQASGVLISNSRFLTSYHVYARNRNIFINSKELLVLKQDKDKDLVLVEWPDAPLIKEVELSEDVKIGDEVYYVGHPAGHQESFVVFGRVNAITENFIYTDAAALPGCSGSGLYNKEGKLIGLINSIYGVEGVGYPFTLATSVKVIRKFLR